MRALPRPLRWPPLFPLLKGLVLWLPFDERSGAKVYDRSGKLNHGTITGASWAAGPRGSALSFEDVTTYVTVSDHDTLDFVTALTLMMWIKTSKTITYQRLLWKADAYGLTTAITAGTVYGTFYSGAAAADSNWSTTNVCDGLWHHVCYVHDTVLTTYQQKMFVDGLLESQKTRAGSIDTSTKDLAIGIQLPTTLPFLGLSNRVRLYNRALTAAEIKRIYESELMLARH